MLSSVSIQEKFKMKLPLIIVLLQLLLIIEISCQTCPQLGVTTSKPPNFIENGYHGLIEITGPFYERKIIDDYFDKRNQMGIIKIHESYIRFERKSAYYYLSSEESFIITEEDCQRNDLINKNGQKLVNLWAPSVISDLVLHLTDNLAPIATLASFISSGHPQFIGNTAIDGRETYHWFDCIQNGGPYYDVYFDVDNSQPVRLMLTYPNRNDLSVAFNFIEFKQIAPKINEPIAYPIGYGCLRGFNRAIGNLSEVVPRFAESPTFEMELEASLFYDDPDKTIITRANVLRNQGIYSFNIDLGNDSSVQVIRDSKLRFDYIVNPDTGECSQLMRQNNSTYLNWPFMENSFNLLTPSIFQLRDDVRFMGQIDKDGTRYDIFERTPSGFFSVDDLSIKAVIVYYFPVDVRKKRNQRKRTPSYIIIKPKRDVTQFAIYLVSKIVLKIIKYSESPAIVDLSRQFDITGCYDRPGQFTWFQVVFNSVPEYLIDMKSRDKALEEEFRSVLSFIPVTRLQDIRVSFLGPSIYITAKLLNQPDFHYDYWDIKGKDLETSSSMVIRNSEEDCARLCTDNSECRTFSYCTDQRCSLYVGSDFLSWPSYYSSNQCTVYEPKQSTLLIDSEATIAQLNERLSSDKLISEIRAMIENRLFNFVCPYISADDVFIVKGPDEIGGPEIYENSDDANNKNDLTAYEVMHFNRRLFQGQRLFGLSYKQCLHKCENDNSCITLSYCSSDNSECTISDISPDKVNSNLNNIIGYSDGCHLIARNYTNLFSKSPGHSLIVQYQTVLSDISLETCAQHCLTSSKLTCDSFTYCHEEPATSCYLQSFYVNNNDGDFDIAQNSNRTLCDYYSKKLSVKYHQLIGKKLKVDSKQIIGEIHDNSLENCAKLCNFEENNCQAFEFCESLDDKSSKFTSACRLSNYQFNINDKSSLESVKTGICSVYFAPKTVDNRKDMSLHNKTALIIAIGFFILIIGAILSAAITRIYSKTSKTVHL